MVSGCLKINKEKIGTFFYITIPFSSSGNCTTPGQFRNTANNICTPCPIGKYNSDKWQDSCTDCTQGYTTQSPGATSSSSCIRKYHVIT